LSGANSKTFIQSEMNTTNRIVFADRRDAGEQLGMALKSRYENVNPLVLGVARGGMEVACHVAKLLRAQLEMVISQKLPLSKHSNIGFGAIAEDMSVYISPKHSDKLQPEEICRVIDHQTDEVNRRISTYRNGSQLADMRGRTVIIVDDGIATGVTLVPVLALCRNRGAKEIVIGVPVCGNNYDDKLDEADFIEILVKPEWFYAVAQSYASFREVTDEHLMSILAKAERSNALLCKQYH
jgi:putative phosphoribosyl transferase